MFVVYQILWAICVLFLYIAWFNAYIRRRTANLSKKCQEFSAKDKKQDLRKRFKDVFSNLSVVASLFMTIQFALIVVGNKTNGLLGATVYYVLFCSLLSSALSFIVSVHMQLVLIAFVVTDEDVELMFSNNNLAIVSFSSDSTKPAFFECTGYDTMGLATASIDGSFQWLTVWVLLWIINNLENSASLALFWSCGMAVAFAFVEFCYRFLDSFLEAKKSLKTTSD